MEPGFKSKYCLPKKIPGYFEEFVQYLETNGKIDRPTSRSVIQSAQQTWPDYASCGKEKKPRKKKSDEEKTGKNEAEPGEETLETSGTSETSKTLEKPKNIVKKLLVFINRNVEDSALKNSMLRILDQFSSTVS